MVRKLPERVLHSQRSPGVLKEELETALKTTNLLPEIREKVNTLASSIQENDNNYLLIGRMKQMNDNH